MEQSIPLFSFTIRRCSSDEQPVNLRVFSRSTVPLAPEKSITRSSKRSHGKMPIKVCLREAVRWIAPNGKCHSPLGGHSSRHQCASHASADPRGAPTLHQPSSSTVLGTGSDAGSRSAAPPMDAVRYRWRKTTTTSTTTIPHLDPLFTSGLYKKIYSCVYTP